MSEQSDGEYVKDLRRQATAAVDEFLRLVDLLSSGRATREAVDKADAEADRARAAYTAAWETYARQYGVRYVCHCEHTREEHELRDNGEDVKRAIATMVGAENRKGVVERYYRKWHYCRICLRDCCQNVLLSGCFTEVRIR